jgi:hypothetical protein
MLERILPGKHGKEAIKYCCYFVRILTRLNTTMLNYSLTLTVIKAFHNFFLIF